MKKQPKKTLNKNAKDLLSPIIKLMYPKCILCNEPTTTAHHFIHDSKCLRTRFEISNLVNLCSGCHFTLHKNECYWAGKIIEIKGLKWFKQLDQMSKEKINPNREWFEEQYNRLYLTYFDLYTNLTNKL